MVILKHLIITSYFKNQTIVNKPNLLFKTKQIIQKLQVKITEFFYM